MKVAIDTHKIFNIVFICTQSLYCTWRHQFCIIHTPYLHFGIPHMVSLTQIVNWLSIGWLLREEISSEDIKLSFKGWFRLGNMHLRKELQGRAHLVIGKR